MVAIYHRVIDGDAPFDSLAHVLDYLWEDEIKDYEASGGCEHSFVHLATVSNWLNSAADWSAQQYVQAGKAGIGTGWRVSATHERPGSRTPPAPGTHSNVRMDTLDGTTIDVTEAARAAGFSCTVSASVEVWRHLIAGEGAFHLKSEEDSLAELLRIVAEAYPGEGRDVYTWFHGADYGPGEMSLIPIKALHRPGPDGSLRLIIWLDWEEDV